MSDNRKEYQDQTRIVAYVPPSLKNKVQEYASQKESSVSSIVETALKNLIIRDVKP